MKQYVHFFNQPVFILCVGVIFYDTTMHSSGFAKETLCEEKIVEDGKLVNYLWESLSIGKRNQSVFVIKDQYYI